MAYTNSWSVIIPAGSDPATVDNDLRQLRLDFQERMNSLVDDFTDDPVVLKAASTTKVYRGASLSIGASTTDEIEFDTEAYDPDDWWDSGDPTKLVVPAGVPSGRPILLVARASIALPTGANEWQLRILQNGAVVSYESKIAGSLTINIQSTIIMVADPADYFEVRIINPDSSSRAFGTGESQTYFAATVL